MYFKTLDYAFYMYTIHRDESGLTFDCSQCTYSVVVHQNKGGAPNSRTFAAGLLRKHAEEEHKTVVIPFRMMPATSAVWFHQSK